jgi:2-oxoisovalerate dehydrogenase E1 component
MISHLGPQLGVADGIALANKLKKNGKLPLFLPEKEPPAKVIFTKLIASVWELPVCDRE